MSQRGGELADGPKNWHLFGPAIDGRSAGMCGQAVEWGHGTTSESEKVDCLACWQAEVKRLRIALERAANIIQEAL